MAVIGAVQETGQGSGPLNGWLNELEELHTRQRLQSWALHISSGVSKGIDKSVVQGGRDFPYIRVGGGQ